MLLLAVDPGGTTGWSLGQTDQHQLLEAGQEKPLEFCRRVHSLVASEDLHIVCERFTITQRTLRVSREGSYDAIEVIGVIRYLSLVYLARDIVFQQPADVMRLFDDERLRRLGWYQRGRGHANDSLRHLAFYMARHCGLVIPTGGTSEP